MKKLVYTLIIGLMLTSASAIAQNTVTSEAVDITINHSTTREELSQLYTQLSEVGLKFQYNPKFDSNKKLVSIQYRIGDNAGNVLGANTTENLQNPAVFSKIIMTKENDAFVVSCIGHCE